MCKKTDKAGVSAIILAAGLSARMGQNKLLLPYQGKPVIESVLEKILQAGFDEIILVTNNSEISKIGQSKDVKIIWNNDSHKGQSYSIKLGLKHAPVNNALMFFVGDQPLLDLRTIRSLLEVFQANRQTKIVVPVCQGKRGNPVIFPACYRDGLSNLTGDVGGKTIINHNLDEVIFVQIENIQVLSDMDNKEDYENLLKQEWAGINKNKVIVRGGGDLATGCVQKLHRSGFQVIVLETQRPTAIRRQVSLCEAVYQGEFQVEDVKCVKINHEQEIEETVAKGCVPLLIDPSGEMIFKIKPVAVVDGIMAKKNLGTNKSMAPVTIALGPGFSAPEDVDVVIETMRGHNLGRLIFCGQAQANTGLPGEINGVSGERVVYAKAAGVIKNLKTIGQVVQKGEVLALIEGKEVLATIDGVLRGIIPDGFYVGAGLKIADIDPRISEMENCRTISDKARNLGGAVLEALLHLKTAKNI